MSLCYFIIYVQDKLNKIEQMSVVRCVDSWTPFTIHISISTYPYPHLFATTESTVGQLSSSTKSLTITASLTVGNSKSTEVADSGCGLKPFSGESSLLFDHRTKRV